MIVYKMGFFGLGSCMLQSQFSWAEHYQLANISAWVGSHHNCRQRPIQLVRNCLKKLKTPLSLDWEWHFPNCTWEWKKDISWLSLGGFELPVAQVRLFQFCFLPLISSVVRSICLFDRCFSISSIFKPVNSSSMPSVCSSVPETSISMRSSIGVMINDRVWSFIKWSDLPVRRATHGPKWKSWSWSKSMLISPRVNVISPSMVICPSAELKEQRWLN